MPQTFLVGNENFSPLIEEIALKFNMSLRGKCFMFVFKEQILNQVFSEADKNSYMFITKLNTIKRKFSKKGLDAYDNLLYRFGLPLDQEIQTSMKLTDSQVDKNLMPLYFNKPTYNITKQKEQTLIKAKLWDEIIDSWNKK